MIPRTAPTEVPTPPPAYLRMEAAARYLSISERTLCAWLRRGILPYSKPARKVTLIAVRDLDRMVDRFRAEPAGRP